MTECAAAPALRSQQQAEAYSQKSTTAGLEAQNWLASVLAAADVRVAENAWLRRARKCGHASIPDDSKRCHLDQLTFNLPCHKFVAIHCAAMATRFVRFREWFARQHPIVKAVVVIGGGAIGAAAGVIAAPAVGAVASGLGLGVAGGTLSGAAASSAGLAALGGGSIASGGLGMAGGTAVVGAVSGALSVGATAHGAVKTHRAGAKSARVAKKAKSEVVNDGDIKFEG